MFVLTFIILAIPFLIFLPTKVIHKERLPKNKKIIVTSNHYSNADTLIYDFKFARKFRYMAKKELFKNKIAGWYMRQVGAYPVDRDNFSPTVYKKTLEILKNNEPVFIFPEGTRNKSGSEDMLSIKSGIINFASRGEADIIPMLMYRPPKIFRKNYILVGEPFKIIGENPKKLTKEEVALNLERYEEVMKNLRIELDEIALKKSKKKNKSKIDKQ